MSQRSSRYYARPKLNEDTRQAIFGGIIATSIALLGIWGVGVTSGREARVLLEATLPSLRFLCSGVMGATASILALMLTLLSLTMSFGRDTSGKLQPTLFVRIRYIVVVDSAVFVAALLLLLFLSFPVGESDSLPTTWFNTIYYIVIGYASLLAGMLITTILMLYNAVHQVIGVANSDGSGNIAGAEEASPSE